MSTPATRPARARGRARGVGRGARIAPCRCPHCSGDLAALAPLLVSSVDVVEVVARLNVERRLATTALVGAYLPKYKPHQVGAALRNAVREKLLSRVREPRAVTGGWFWRYEATSLAPAYIRSPALARLIATSLHAPLSPKDVSSPSTPPPARFGRAGQRLGGGGSDGSDGSGVKIYLGTTTPVAPRN